MPVAQRQISFAEESQQLCMSVGGDDIAPILPIPPKLDLSIFEQIKASLDTTSSCKDKTNEDERKLEKLSKHIQAAEEMLAKAVEKKEALLKKNTFLKEKYDKINERKLEALKYWQEYGLDIRQISKDDDDFKHYEFIYTKLPDKELLQPITIGLKYQNDQINIISKTPSNVLTDEQIQQINVSLTNNARASKGHVDYKLAMIMIRKALITTSHL